MNYATLHLKLINHQVIPSNISDTQRTWAEKAISRIRTIENLEAKKVNYRNLKYSGYDKKRSKPSNVSLNDYWNNVIAFAEEAYNQSTLVQKTELKKIEYYRRFIAEPKTDDEKKYKRRYNRMMKYTKVIEECIFELRTNRQGTWDNLLDTLLDKMPVSVYTHVELHVYARIHEHFYLPQSQPFIISNKSNYHSKKDHVKGNYADLFKYLAIHTNHTSRSKFFIGDFHKHLKSITQIPYNKLYELIMYDFNSNHFTNSDLTVMKTIDNSITIASLESVIKSIKLLQKK